VPFSAQYLVCRHVQTDRRTDRQTDRQTDKLIQVVLGNQRFLQVNRSLDPTAASNWRLSIKIGMALVKPTIVIFGFL
jgi:hypothetical protein